MHLFLWFSLVALKRFLPRASLFSSHTYAVTVLNAVVVHLFFWVLPNSTASLVWS